MIFILLALVVPIFNYHSCSVHSFMKNEKLAVGCVEKIRSDQTEIVNYLSEANSLEVADFNATRLGSLFVKEKSPKLSNFIERLLDSKDSRNTLLAWVFLVGNSPEFSHRNATDLAIREIGSVLSESWSYENEIQLNLAAMILLQVPQEFWAESVHSFERQTSKIASREKLFSNLFGGKDCYGLEL